MRKAKALSVVAAAVFAVAAKNALADTPLFNTQADFGGSGYAAGGAGYASGFSGEDPTVVGYGPAYYNPGTTPTAASIAAGQQTGWDGWGEYDGSGGVYAQDTNGDAVVYNNTALSGATTAVNGLGNFANDYAATDYPTTPVPPFNSNGTDPNIGASWAGQTGAAGSITMNDVDTSGDLNSGAGQETQLQSGEMVVANSTASAAFLANLQNSHAIAIDFTAPGGGTTLTSAGGTGGNYYILNFGTFATYLTGGTSTNGGFNTSQYDWANPSSTLSSKDVGYYGDQPGSFVVQNGTGANSYWTAYIPYSYPTGVNAATAAASLQMFITLNSYNYKDGNVTIGNIRTVSPTWAASGSGLSWNTGATLAPDTNDPGGNNVNSEDEMVTSQGNWIGAVDTYVDANGNTDTYGLGVPNGSGVSVTFGDLETGNASVGLDTNQTVGTLIFDSVGGVYNAGDPTGTPPVAPFIQGAIQYNLTASSTAGTGAGGTLIMDNTVNSAPAAINDTSTAAIQYITAPVQLNSSTIVTVSNAGDAVFFGSAANALGNTVGGISGVGGMTIAGPGTVQFAFANTYSGGTTVSSGSTLIASAGNALPTGHGVMNNGTLDVTGGSDSLGAAGVSALTGTGALSIGAAGSPATVQLAVGSGGATQGSLTIAANSSLDIGNNHIILSDAGGAIDATIRSYLSAGYNNGNWNGTGAIGSIVTSSVTGTKYGIGYADGADGGISGISSGQLEVKYTLYGDANLDGAVNSVDFGNLAANFGKSNKVWDQGDFNYDGTVNSIDFGLLAGNFGKSVGSNADVVTSADWAALDAFAAANGLMADVPEPASMGLLAVSGLAILARRRRSSRSHAE